MNKYEGEYCRKTFLHLLLKSRRKQLSLERQGKQKYWLRPIFQKREEYEEYHRLIEELRTEDIEYLFR